MQAFRAFPRGKKFQLPFKNYNGKDYLRKNTRRLNLARSILNLSYVNGMARVKTLVQKLGASWAGIYICGESDCLFVEYGRRVHGFEPDFEQEQALLGGKPLTFDEGHAEPLTLSNFVVGFILIEKKDWHRADPLHAEVVSLNAQLISMEIEQELDTMSFENYVTRIQTERIKHISDEEQRSIVLGMAAHDLSSPVNAINGYLELIENNIEREKNLEEIRSYYKKISHGMKDISAIVSHFNDFSRLKLEKRTSSFVLINLNWVLDDLCEFVSINAEKKNLELIHAFSGKPVFVRADLTKLKRAVMNLISNAIKFTKKGGYIKVMLESNDEEAIIRVKDNGIGIRKNEQEQIFNPFIQLSEYISSEDPGSMGLGLYITQSFVQQMNGRIELESEADVGSCFSIFLPVAGRE